MIRLAACSERRTEPLLHYLENRSGAICVACVVAFGAEDDLCLGVKVLGAEVVNGGVLGAEAADGRLSAKAGLLGTEEDGFGFTFGVECQ
ncbi:hypothetical protein NDU88_007566 [Pleurodeles waltl]|uniref:Uncharacterized protein n=1 Tax=Pleurodeles waltl TaxID=8319 RepID=A0AAV7RS94_PLEWA|nr:hypothetical protein NDU88_007566 [Pleurodeles waltl]